MANINDTKADLGLVVGITDQWQNSNMATGAGANANSRVDMMTFLGSDTLAELVWSPQIGLSIKFADKKPCVTWEVSPSDIIGESSTLLRNVKSPHNERASELLSNHLFENGMASQVDGPCLDTESPLKIEALTQCTSEEDFENVNVKIEKDGCFNDPVLENAQDVVLENEKPFYCQENDEKHEVDSHGSIESCKSGNFLSEKKRSLNFEQQLILSNKRIKKQAHEHPTDGSFMNWISNMLKYLKNHENQSVYDNDRGYESRKMGLQSVLRSLSLPDVKAHETATQINKFSHGSPDFFKIKEKEAKGVVKHISLYERVTQEAPKGIFDTIRRLRLSRTDILKWTNSQLSFAHLDGFFLRLRVAKWEEGATGSRYYVACITGLRGENPWEGLKQPICVKVGGVECLVESQYVSNCDFLEDELIAWWQNAPRDGAIPFMKDLTSKLAERKTLGL